MFLWMRSELLGELGKPEVCYFDFAIANEYVGHFDVAVNNVFISEVAESFEDILDDRFCLQLAEISLFPQP